MEILTLDRGVALVGIILAIYGTYATVSSNKKVYPFHKFSNLFVMSHSSKKLNKFKLLFNDIILEQAGVLNLIFWNGGNTTLNYIDVPSNYPFRLMFNKTSRILDAYLIHETGVYNAVKLTYSDDNNFIDISFDFFEPDEGFVIKVIHTDLKPKEIKLQAVFKGAAKLDKASVYEVDSTTMITTTIMSLMLLVYYVKKFNGLSIGLHIICILGLLLATAANIKAYTDYFRARRKKMPKDLKAIFNESESYMYEIKTLLTQ